MKPRALAENRRARALGIIKNGVAPGARMLARAWPPLVPLLACAFLAEALVSFGAVPRFLLPAPTDVARSLCVDAGEFAAAAWATASAAAIGLALSFVAGLAIALALSLSAFARRAFYPYAVFFQTVPIIAIAPLLVIWFGYGRPTVIASSFVVSLFPVVASSLLGLESTDPALLDLFRLYGASRAATLLRLRLPFAAPQIFSGLRIASGLAVIGAIVGEFVGGGGLGSVVDAARTQQRADKVFAAVLVSAALGLVLVALIDFASRRALRRWHASARDG
jgi:NitT/TauT family transport system permease protein